MAVSNSSPAVRSPSSSISSISIISSPLSYEDPLEEQIVWTGPNSVILSSESHVLVEEDDDYVLLSPAASAKNGSLLLEGHTANGLDAIAKQGGPEINSTVESSVESLIPGINALTIESKSTTSAVTVRPPPQGKPCRNRSKPIKAKACPPSTPAQPPTKAGPPQPKKGNDSKKHRRTSSAKSIPTYIPTYTPPAVTSIGLGERPIVDDVSDVGAENSLYESAAQFMASVLSSPDMLASSSRLDILQALIVELGLVDSEMALPTSLTAARSLLRSRVFMNVVDYLKAREKGQEALQQVMHKNRSALIRHIRRNKKHRAPLGWVKESGLSVLLVSCY